MLTLLLTLSVSTLPAPAQVIPAPSPGLPAPFVPPVQPVQPVSPYGPDWQWDAALRTWVRYGPVVPAVAPAPVNVWQPAPQPPPLKYYPQFVPAQPVQQHCPTGFCPWRR